MRIRDLIDHLPDAGWPSSPVSVIFARELSLYETVGPRLFLYEVISQPVGTRRDDAGYPFVKPPCHRQER